MEDFPLVMTGGGVVYNDFANLDISLAVMFGSGVLAALGGVSLINSNRSKLVAYSKEEADQFDVVQEPSCTSELGAEVTFKDLEPFSKLDAARHERHPSFVCGIAASMGHALEESIVHHADKHKALERLVEAHDEAYGAASLPLCGEVAQRQRVHHLRMQAAVDLQKQRRSSWNPALGYARAFELPPPVAKPLRRSALVTASPRQFDVQVFKPRHNYDSAGYCMVIQFSSPEVAACFRPNRRSSIAPPRPNRYHCHIN